MPILKRNPPVPVEMLGYFCGVTAALLVFGLASAAHPEDGISAVGRSGPAWLIMAVTAMLVPLLPCLLLRVIIDLERLKDLTYATASGVAVGAVSLPIVFAASRFLTPGTAGFADGLISTVRFTWPLYAGAGATGGLVWWFVLFSQPMAMVRGVLATPDGRRGMATIRGGAVCILGLCMLTAAGWQSGGITRPVSRPSAAFVLLTEVPVNAIPSHIAWAPDGQTWAALSSVDPWLAICGVNGENLREFTSPYAGVTSPPVFTRDGRSLVIAGTLSAEARHAVSAIDAQTGETVFAIRDPAPTAPGEPGQAVSLAASSDGGTLAIAFNGFRPGQPVSLFRTNDWVRSAVLGAVPGAETGVGAVSLSADARLLLAVTREGITLIDTSSGQVRRTINLTQPVVGMALSPDGSMAAIAGDTAVRVVRLADGIELAAYVATARISGGVTWDPKQRYVAFADEAGTLHFWRPFQAGGQETRFQIRSPAGGIAFSPSGDRVAVGNGKAISFFEVNGS